MNSPENSERTPSRKSRLGRVLKIGGIAILAIVALALAAGYLFRDRIGQELKSRLATQLERRGVPVAFEASEFSPFRGVTLRDIRVYRDASRQAEAIGLSGAELHFSLIGLAKDRSGASVKITTEGAELVLRDDTGEVPIEALDAELRMNREGMAFDHLSGRCRDLRFDVAGEIAWSSLAPRKPETGASETARNEGEQRIDVSGLTDVLRKIPDTSDGEAGLELTVTRPADLSKFRMAGKLSGDTVNWNGIAAREVRLEFDLAREEGGDSMLLRVPAVKLKAGGGELAASGDWNLTEKWIRLSSLTSTLSADLLARLFAVENNVLSSLPPFELRAEGEIGLGGSRATDVTGKVAMPGPASVPLGKAGSAILSELRSDFAWKGQILEFSGFEGRLGAERSLSMEGDLTVPLGGGKEGQSAQNPGRPIVFKPFLLRRGDGSLEANGSVDVRAGRMTLASLESDLALPAALIDLGIANPALEKIEFSAPPEIEMSGALSFRSLAKDAELKGSFEAPGALRIHGAESRVAEFEKLSTLFSVSKGQLLLTDFETAAFGGTAKIPQGSIPLASGPLTMKGRVNLDSMRLETMTEFFGVEKKRTGVVGANFQGTISADIAAVNGTGDLKISEADFGTVPVFRGLQPLLSAVTLGGFKGNGAGTTLTSTFGFENGVCTSDDVRLQGGFYEVHSGIRLDFPARRLNADGYVSTSGATRVLTQVVGKALEVEASGSFDDFSWKLKNAPGVGTVADLAGLPAGVLEKTLSAAAKLELPGDLRPGEAVKDAAGGAVKGAARLGEKLLNLGGGK